MPKDTKTLGNNKALACESRGFVHEKEVCFSTHLHIFINIIIASLIPETFGLSMPAQSYLRSYYFKVIKMMTGAIDIKHTNSQPLRTNL